MLLSYTIRQKKEGGGGYLFNTFLETNLFKKIYVFKHYT